MKNIFGFLSLAPACSPVTADRIMQNRFNGLVCAGKPLKRLIASLAVRTRRTHGVNERAALILGVSLLMAANGGWGAAFTSTDALTFGDARSEGGHVFSETRSEIISGGLGETARRLLPLEKPDWRGGHLTFTLKVDPEKQNYATLRLWGDDVTQNHLVLYCEGKQVGYFHLGDIDQLDFGTEAPGYNGRFYYVTTPLPLAMTRAKSELKCEIRSLGPIWGYGSTFAQYQKPMSKPTRGLYKIYSHTDGFFAPPAEEKQGGAPVNPPVRTGPGAEVLAQLKQRENRELENLLKSAKPVNQMQMQFLAKAYSVKWTPACQNSNAVAQVVKSLDALFVAYRENPRLAQSEPSTWNPEWFGLGPAGDAIRLLAGPLKPFLDQTIDDGAGKKITRRAAFSEMLLACRDWHRLHRRLYSNQTMINDLFGIYLANGGVAAIDPANALPENEIRRYLYESIGLEPWRDSDPGGHRWAVGENYFQLTGQGLTKELGYVGNYGEVLDWVTAIYDATRPMPGEPGDAKIKAQLEKICRARAAFRYPMLDAEGNRAMRLEATIGWRDEHFPGDINYAQRPSWDGDPLESPAATLEPHLIGYAQQMLADNQFFASVQDRMNDKGFRVTAGLLAIPDQYEIIKAQPPSAFRLPMSPGQPDFVFSDEEDGVVAIKHGDEILYVSLYWRARYAINFLARVHFVTPRFSRVAVVRAETEFEPSGLTYTRPDWVNFGFGNGGPNYPAEIHSAHAGEKFPIAKIPDGVKFKPGDESVYAGKGRFYTLRYGNYLIGQNLTTDKTFELKSPAGVSEAKELVSGKVVRLVSPLKVTPRSTVVLWLGKN